MTVLRLAGPDDDAQLRRLLRDNGMLGWVEMAIQREPSYAAGLDHFGRDWAVLAEDGDDTVGMYSASVLPLHVNGAVEQVGYLGGLRVQTAHRRRIRHLREGYASIRPLAPVPASLPWWFTVVAADNQVARRLLEAGVRGLPRYRAIGSYTTHALATVRGRSRGLWRGVRPGELPALLAWHQQLAAQQQLTPALDEQRLAHIGLHGLRVCTDGDGFVGMAVLWDQSAWKQVVARRYRGALRWLLPSYNAYARLMRRVVLPAQGEALKQSFVAFLTLAPQVLADRSMARDLLADLLSTCPTPVAALGLHDEHPLLPVLSGFAPLRYAAKVYAVEFDEPARLDDRPVQPEAALF
jgi:hypothetical protein